MELNNKCENCIYARKAENSEYVGCIALLPRLVVDENAWFSFYGKESISTGWVDLKAKPNENSSCMITNGIPCFKKNDICKHFKLN